MICRQRFRSAISAFILCGFGLAALPAIAATEWETAAPASEDIDSAVLGDLVLQIRAGDHSNIHSLLVIRHSRLILEEYFSGPDERRDPVVGSKPVGMQRFDADSLHDMRSVSKSIVSILFGIAQSRGLIGGLDQPVLSFFPQYAELRTADRMAIRLRDVLSMTPGWEWDEDSSPYGDPTNSETAMDNAADPYRYILERRIIAKPGEKFQYNGGTTLLLGAIIERATKMPLAQYAQQVLFRPLGITKYEWIRYANGKAIPASGLRLRPRDLAKIAQLYLQRGRWGGRTLVPESWVRISTAPQAPGGFYGFHWWVGTGPNGPFGPSGPWALAVGYGGQRALIIPSLDLVVVITAGLYNDRRQAEVVNKVLRQCVEAVKR